MSYDWKIRRNECDKCLRSDVLELNYTYNVSPMFHEALNGSWYDDFSGKNGWELLPILERGIADMKARSDYYKKMNPPNGWGNYEGALNVLETLLKWFTETPDATLRVS